MPQMNPMNLIFLFFLFILLFYMIINLWSFHTLTRPNNYLYNKVMSNKSWKW